MELQKSKRILSDSKNTKKNGNSNKAKILKVYGFSFTDKRGNMKQKVKINNKRKDSQGYQFPEFSIAFKESEKQTALRSCIENQASNRKTQNSKKPMTKKKKPNQDKVCKDAVNTTIKHKQSQSLLNYYYSNAKDSRKREIKSPLEKEYLDCIQKVFNTLDIFKKGNICQANINKWLPESALYFLGKVFQKIRSEKLILNCSQFQSLCLGPLNESNFEDVQWFIQEINSISSLQKTAKIPKNQVVQLSPIQKRIFEEEYLKKYSNQKLSYKNLHYQDLITIIKAKEAETGQKINQIKQKRKAATYNILAQKKVNFQQNTPQKDTLQTKLQASCFINISNFEEDEQNSIPIKKSNARNDFKLQNFRIPKSSIQKVFDQVQLENHNISSLTLHLPQAAEQDKENRLQKSEVDTKFQDIFNRYQKKLLKVRNPQIRQPFSDRCQSKHHLQFKAQKPIENSFRQNHDEDHKRLDHLRNKVETFLKQNAQKIQKNKSVYLQSFSSQL